MGSAVASRGLMLLVLAALPGCALWQQRPPLAAASVELSQTPFFPQQDHMCGPAALATALGAAGADVHPDALIAGLYLPERRGTLQVELQAAARRRGYLAVRVEETPAALVRQLEGGRPVLVLQNLGLQIRPVWHYAVVVGYQPERERFVLRSGRQRRALVRRGRFEATWRRAGNWGLVVVPPDASPQGLPRRGYLQAAADLENTGAHETALRAFESAAMAWPDEPTARLGVANNLYYLGRLEEAAGAYRSLLADHPGHEVATHNLTMLLLELGQPCAARRLLADSPAPAGALLDTARRAVAAAVRDDAGAPDAAAPAGCGAP